MSYRFQAEAEIEFLEAIRFYEEQRPGLGAALIVEFERIIALANERSDSWKQVHRSGIRQIDLRRFPYAVFYRKQGDESLIVAATG